MKGEHLLHELVAEVTEHAILNGSEVESSQESRARFKCGGDNEECSENEKRVGRTVGVNVLADVVEDVVFACFDDVFQTVAPLPRHIDIDPAVHAEEDLEDGDDGAERKKREYCAENITEQVSNHIAFVVGQKSANKGEEILHAGDVVLDASVVERRNGVKFRFDSVADVECVNERLNAFLCNGGIGAGEVFECLVRFWIAFSAQDGLDAFCHDCPVVVEVCLDGVFVEQQFIKSFECTLDGNEGVTEWVAEVA